MLCMPLIDKMDLQYRCYVKPLSGMHSMPYEPAAQLLI